MFTFWKVNLTAQSKSDSLREQVYQTLRSALRKGRIGSSRIATERDLADELRVSRTPVREALALLMHEGLVSYSSRGFSPPELSRRDISDLFEIRRMLEPGALAATIDHLSAHDVKSLRQLLMEQESADVAGDVTAFTAANLQFRAVWLAAVPNEQLRALIELHDDHVQWMREATLHDDKVRKKVVAGLRTILTAIDAGKPAAVAAAMLEHMNAAERALAQTVESSSTGHTTA